MAARRHENALSFSARCPVSGSRVARQWLPKWAQTVDVRLEREQAGVGGREIWKKNQGNLSFLIVVWINDGTL